MTLARRSTNSRYASSFACGGWNEYNKFQAAPAASLFLGKSSFLSRSTISLCSVWARNEDLPRNNDAAGAAWNLLYSFQPPQANEDAYRELVDILANLMLSAGSNTATRN